MKLQLCEFKRNKFGDYEKGVAAVKAFGMCDVDYIIDNLGIKVKKLWTYRLIERCAYSTIDTDIECY